MARHLPILWKSLDSWPGEFAHRRKRSAFEAGFGATLDLLDRELRQLSATDIVIEMDLTPGQMRVDGTGPKARSQAPPPVKLSFTSKHGPLVYATDRFDAWQDNLRAIALGLEALRKVDRYGISTRGEQYAGWAQLEAGGPSREEAITVVADIARMTFDQVDGDLKRGWRQALIRSHPDHGGDPADWDRLQFAGQTLGLA